MPLSYDDKVEALLDMGAAGLVESLLRLLSQCRGTDLVEGQPIKAQVNHSTLGQQALSMIMRRSNAST